MFKKIFLRPELCSVMAMFVLAGCTPVPTASAAFDMTLEHAETSPIPGASARVMPPPPGIVYSGAPVGTCVTEAGYCPLASQTEPGQNCLCTASDGTYGGTTGMPPATMPK